MNHKRFHQRAGFYRRAWSWNSGYRLLAAGFLLCLFLGSPRILAETDPQELITDRPDQTESSRVISPGYFQMETGWTYTTDDEDDVRIETHEAPGTLLRIGLIDRVELRLGWSGYISEEIRDRNLQRAEDGSLTRRITSDETEIGDAELGTKIFLWEEQGWIPETALLASVSLPIGSEKFSSDRFDPSFRFNMSHTLSDRFSLGYNLGATWESEEDDEGDRDTLSSFNYTATVGIGLTDRLGMFVEFFGDVPFNAQGGPAHSIDGGFTYQLRPNLQFDVALGGGLSDDADDFFVTAGFSVRFPR